ncbi:DUF4129 domain-containing protein [Halorubrum laminariae]|uniref:DUF4129 domain-containing protein n=1 Tax=Halorubrum laminariae TaxID=1433523 RepID=UPI0036D3E401
MAGVSGPTSDVVLQTGPTTDDSTNTTNRTPPHTNPDEIDEAGDNQRVATYLATRLGSRLNVSAVAVSDQAFDDGRAPLGEDYDVLLERYSAVAADIDAEETADRFNLTREQQRAIIDSAEDLNQTALAYQRAVEAGNDERARELGREIIETTAELNASTESLTEQYAALEEETDINLDGAQAALNQSQQTLSQAAAAVAQREFTETTLTVETNRTTLSGGAPVRVTGQLTTTDGEPISDAPLTVGIGTDTVTTQTNDTGRFTTTYQPLLAPINASTLTVTYEPTSSAPYLGATATQRVSLTEQADTELRLANSTETAAFSETVRVNGTVHLLTETDRPLDGIPVVLTVDGQRLATATTDRTGAVSLADELPADIPDGTTELGVAIDRQDLAIAPSTATTQLTVQPTSTSLSVDAVTNTTNTTTVSVAGQLTTASGEPLADRELGITLGETRLGVVETDQTGAYQANYTVPDSVGRTADLTVAYDGTGTSLTGSTVTQQLSFTTVGWPRLGIALAAGFVVVSLIVVVFVRPPDWRWVRRLRARVTNEPVMTPSPSDPSDMAVSSSPDADGGDANATAHRHSFDHAQAALAAGHPNAAVQIAYGVARNHLRSDNAQPAETHWEFYQRWQRTGRPEIDSDHLRQLTELYETAAFSPHDISMETADDIVSTVEDRFR